MASRIGAVGEDDVGDHDGAGDRAPARPRARHPYGLVPVDHRLDLLGMDLQPADVDDAAAPADEVVALAAQLDHVAGVDEALGIGERGRIGADIGARRAVGADPE